MRDELRRRYERLRREESLCARERKLFEELRMAVKVKPLRRTSSNPDGQIEFPELLTGAEKTGLEKIMNRVMILAEYGKDPEAERLIRKLGYAFVLMRARDFWTYLYDWTQEAIELLKAREIEIPI